jgi:CHASE2 domain-containing sensor protein
MPIPRVSLQALLSDPGRASDFSGKVVFAGVTSQTAAKDWLFTPYSTRTPMVGVEIHANAFETIAQGLFLTDAPASAVLAFSLLLVVALGLTYSRLTGRRRSAWPPAFWRSRT